MAANPTHGILNPLDRVREVIAESLGLDLEEVFPSSKFVELGADSLEMARLILDLEDEFQIEIPQDDMRALLCVQDVLKFL